MDCRRFVVLVRAFFAQFFISESVTSDVQMRQAIIGVLAFIVLPGLMLLIQLFPEFLYVAIRVKTLHAPRGLIDDMLEWVVLMLLTYSLVTVGLIAVFAWDALSFDRRDAMVLGPLPLRGATIVTAKLAALAGLLLASSIAISLPTGVVFAIETSEAFGQGALARHFIAFFLASVGAATFVFAAIVMMRGTVALVGGARLAAAAGSVLQFLFVLALLWFVVLSPATEKVRFVTRGMADAMPQNWFLGLFELLRGSPRRAWPEFATLAHRAILALPIVVGGAVATSVATFRRQMHVALTPSAAPGPLGRARLSRAIARLLVGRDQLASATSDFVLTTIARNRLQQAPTAFGAAVGLAVVSAGFSKVNGLASLTHPRAAVLWIPFVLAYWAVVGLRASFFVPSELPASWTFGSNAPATARAYWSGTRAAMIAFVVPPALLLTVVAIGPLLGWRIAAWHAAFVLVILVALIDFVALTIDRVPFTRPYHPGHAKLKTRWPWYVLGMFAVAYWPVRIELWTLGGGELGLLGVALVVAVALYLIGRRAGAKWSTEPREEPSDDLGGISVLDIGRVTAS